MRNFNQGFTLIEGISVMLILGVLTAFAAPRFSGTELFSVIGTRDVGLSVARQIQLRAMQQENPMDPCHALEITDFRLGSRDLAICARQKGRTDILDLIDSGITAVSTNKTIYFDLLGRPSNGTNRICLEPTGCKITLVKGSVSSSFCLNAEGYFDVACSG